MNTPEVYNVRFLCSRISLPMCLPIDKLSRLALTQEEQQMGNQKITTA